MAYPETVSDLKMHVHCNFRGQKRQEALIQSQRKEMGEDQNWRLVSPSSFFGSITVYLQVLALEKVGQGRPTLSCPLLL